MYVIIVTCKELLNVVMCVDTGSGIHTLYTVGLVLTTD